jgi:Zn-dependent M28 family amino/carboxypeptidase
MKRLRAATVLFVLAACSRGDQSALAPIDAARLAEHIRVLASDEFMGRGPGTPGEDTTVAYIAEQLRSAGLEPAGTDGGWYQEVPLSQSAIVGRPVLAISVGGRRFTLTQGEQIVVRATTRNEDSVAIDRAPLVFLGFGVHAPERDWNDFQGQDLRGRVGVVLINDPDFESGQGDFGGKAMTYYGRWTYKYQEAARQGLAGLLIVHETEPASYGWATVANSNASTTFDIVRANPADVHPPVEGWIQRDLAVELFRAAGQDFEALKRRAQTREFRPVPLGDATFSATFNVRRATIQSRNVVGMLRGTTHADETILFGTHWDHLGIGAPGAAGDSIYNGAVDNATGVAAMLEIARTLAAAPRPQRSIVFAAWTAEEKGLLGSEYYAANPLYPLETTVAGINLDALEPHGPARDVIVVGYGQTDLEERLERLVAGVGRVVAHDPHPEAGYFFRSDNFSAAKRGVPVLYVDSGIDLLDGGRSAGEAAGAAYIRDRYHQPDDEFDPVTWNTAGMAEDAALLHRLALELANSREWPNYRETSEFRPIRDASASRRQ